MAALNTERLKRGLRPLSDDAKLQSMAQYWALRMTDLGLTHLGFEQRFQSVYKNRGGGEIVAEGQDSVDQVVHAWMNSPGHRANILDPSFTAAGSGVATSRAAVKFWCVDFVA